MGRLPYQEGAAPSFRLWGCHLHCLSCAPGTPAAIPACWLWWGRWTLVASRGAQVQEEEEVRRGSALEEVGQAGWGSPCTLLWQCEAGPSGALLVKGAKSARKNEGPSQCTVGCNELVWTPGRWWRARWAKLAHRPAFPLLGQS